MGEPKFIDYNFEDKPLTMQQQVIGGISRNHYYHKISFPFTGSKELFSYTPENGFSFSGSDRGLLIPRSNEIILYVDLPEVNPTLAISQARGLISMTMQFVNNNNASLQSWRVVVGQRIDEQLRIKREELIKIFGTK